MDWVNRMQKISNKFKFQLFGRKVLDLEACYANTVKYDPDQSGFMSEVVFNQFLNSFGVFLTTQELRTISDHYKELGTKINYREFIQSIRKDISQKRLATIQHSFEQLSSDRVSVALSTIIQNFDPEMHPHNRTRTKEGEKLQQEFIAAINRRSGDGKVLTQQEYFEYFFDVNACVPVEREEYFIDIVIHGFGINKFTVTKERLKEVELTMYEKIRQKTYIKGDEGNASKRAFRYFDLEDKGIVDYKRFADGLDKLNAKFKDIEMRAVFSKHTKGSELMTYEQFCSMFFEMGSGVVYNPNPIYQLAQSSGGYITSNGMTKKIT